MIFLSLSSAKNDCSVSGGHFDQYKSPGVAGVL